MSKPLYIHDCDKCLFLEHSHNYDLYCCSNEVIARFGNEPHEYIAAPIAVHLSPVLKIALDMAIAKKLI